MESSLEAFTSNHNESTLGLIKGTVLASNPSYYIEIFIRQPVDGPKACITRVNHRFCINQCDEEELTEMALYGHDLTEAGSAVEISCQVGSKFSVDGELIDKLRYTCQWNGTWSRDLSVPSCVVLGCGDPPEPPPDKVIELYSYFTPLLPENSIYDVGHTLTFIPKFDNWAFFYPEKEPALMTNYEWMMYSYAQQFDIYCQPNGTWSENWLAARPFYSFECDPPPAPIQPGGISSATELSSFTVNTNVKYSCEPGKILQLPDNSQVSEFYIRCGAGQRWDPPADEMPTECVINGCLEPPSTEGLTHSWDGRVLEPGESVEYRPIPGYFFEKDRELVSAEATCLQDGSYDISQLSRVTQTTFCKSDPPDKPHYPRGSREWPRNKEGSLDYEFGTRVIYSCGPHANFRINGVDEENFIVTCLWNKTWDFPALPPCFCELGSLYLLLCTLI